METLWVFQHSWLIPLLPLIGAAIAGFFGAKWLKGNSHWPIWIGVGISAIMAITLLFQTTSLPHHESAAEKSAAAPESASPHNDSASAAEKPFGTRFLFNWIEVGNPDPKLAYDAKDPGAHFVAPAAFFFDSLTVVMLCVVCGIGFLITVFAAGYMKGEEGYFRFFAYLGLFIFMMTCLVMGNNLIMLYLGWEGVGLCSYLLIGYYYEKPSAREAAKKAFLVNRIGDFGFGVGIMLCYTAFGTINFFSFTDHGVAYTGLLNIVSDVLCDPGKFAALTAYQHMALDWIPFCLMLGAFGKSAQFPLYVWLPDAMEGPTPVSALIHAATMVTAGVYMIARCGPLFVQNPSAMSTVAAVGCFTAILAATIALRQFDLKKVFAYSTISQLGFMFVAVGVLAPVAGVFHLVTHAFFKALLFLSSGVVMHAMAGELDMRKMSGLKKVLPKTRWLMLIGCLALSGFPLFSGFFSKDEIVGAAWHASPWLGGLLLLTAFMTAYYTFRLYFRVFEGPLVVPAAPAPAHGHGHEPHQAAAASHSAVATGTAKSSGVDVGQTHHQPAHSPDEHHHNHEPWIMMAPLFLLAAGALLAGYLNFPSEKLGDFLGQSPSLVKTYEVARDRAIANPAAEYPNAAALGATIIEKPAEHEWGLMGLSGAIALAGIGLAYFFHLRARAQAEALAQGMRPVVSLLDHKFWVDEIYQGLIVTPLRKFGQLLNSVFDRGVIDGLVTLAGGIPQVGGIILKITVQRGFLQGYAAAMLFGVAIILLIIFMH
jgi:NADH-quinone oxidoreductase subunit L